MPGTNTNSANAVDADHQAFMDKSIAKISCIGKEWSYRLNRHAAAKDMIDMVNAGFNGISSKDAKELNRSAHEKLNAAHNLMIDTIREISHKLVAIHRNTTDENRRENIAKFIISYGEIIGSLEAVMKHNSEIKILPKNIIDRHMEILQTLDGVKFQGMMEGSKYRMSILALKCIGSNVVLHKTDVTVTMIVETLRRLCESHDGKKSDIDMNPKNKLSSASSVNDSHMDAPRIKVVTNPPHENISDRQKRLEIEVRKLSEFFITVKTYPQMLDDSEDVRVFFEIMSAIYMSVISKLRAITVELNKAIVAAQLYNELCINELENLGTSFVKMFLREQRMMRDTYELPFPEADREIVTLGSVLYVIDLCVNHWYDIDAHL